METRFFGQVDYFPTFDAMRAFTARRTTQGTASEAVKTVDFEHKNDLKPNNYVHDQLWICEHSAVYTQGLAGKVEHVLNPGSIPVVQTDRGGQVTIFAARVAHVYHF